MPLLPDDVYVSHLRADAEFMGSVDADHLDDPIAACPGWTVADLLVHTAGVYRFATAQLRAEGSDEMVPFDPPEPAPAAVQLTNAATELLAEMVAVDPDEPRPNWHGAPTARFYWRRMAQETAVHRADLELAIGATPVIDPELAIDGIEEFIDTFLTHAKRRGITGTGESVHFHATDEGIEGGEWTFTFTPDGVDVERSHAKGDFAVRGPASELLLFTWNRATTRLECFGEGDAARWWAGRVRI